MRQIHEQPYKEFQVALQILDRHILITLNLCAYETAFVAVFLPFLVPNCVHVDAKIINNIFSLYVKEQDC